MTCESRAMKVACKVASTILFSEMEVTGRQYIPSTGPAIAAFNHMAWGEILPLISLFPENTIALMKEETLRLPFIGPLTTRLGWIPIKRGALDRKALYGCVTALTQGKILLIAPEGTRGRDTDNNRTELKEAHNGLSYVAQKAAQKLETRIPVYPVAVWGGLEHVFPLIDEPDVPVLQRLIYSRETTYVAVGPAIIFDYISDGRYSREFLQEKTNTVMEEIKNLLPTTYHGHYT